MSSQIDFFSGIEEPYDFISELEEPTNAKEKFTNTEEVPDFFEELDVNHPKTQKNPVIEQPLIENVIASEQPDFFDEIEPQQRPKLAMESLYAKEKTPEEIKSMSAQERYEYAQDLVKEREYRKSRGFTKGALSGATFGLSEKISGLSPEEGEFLSGIGEFVGSILPISKLYNFL